MTEGKSDSPRPSPGTGTDTGSTPGAVLAVEARGLVKTFGTNRAVDGIDLVVHEGEIFCVLGPNGAGKTTMLQMLATLLPIESGSAAIFGYDVRRQPHAVRQLIGVTGSTRRSMSCSPVARTSVSSAGCSVCHRRRPAESGMTSWNGST